jgi:hypothetical protein
LHLSILSQRNQLAHTSPPGPVAFYAITALSTISLLQCYCLSIGCVLWRRIVLPSTLPPAEFSLGRWGIPINALAVLYSLWAFFWACWPQEVSSCQSSIDCYVHPLTRRQYRHPSRPKGSTGRLPSMSPCCWSRWCTSWPGRGIGMRDLWRMLRVGRSGEGG